MRQTSKMPRRNVSHKSPCMGELDGKKIQVLRGAFKSRLLGPACT